MTIISAGVLSHSHPLVTRQFTEITKLQVEELYSTFLNQIDRTHRDYTFIESENVSYMYQPIENLFLVLVCAKNTNILEQLDTLKIIHQCVKDICGTQVTERRIVACAYPIIFALDEILPLGLKEAITVAQVHQNISMDSHEERMQKLITANKEKDEAEKRKNIAMKLDKERRNKSHSSRATAVSAIDNLSSSYTQPVYQETTHIIDSQTLGMKSGMQMNTKRTSGSGFSFKNKTETMAVKLEPKKQSIAEDAEIFHDPLQKPLDIKVNENVSGEINNMGDMKHFDVNGNINMTVLNANKVSDPVLSIDTSDNSCQYKLHPNCDKVSFKKSILKMRNAASLRPRMSIPILGWKLNSKDSKMIPFTICCWLSSGNDATTATIELEVIKDSETLKDITVSFSHPGSVPDILNRDQGSTLYENDTLIWTIEQLEGNGSSCALLEFSTELSEDDILPFSFECVSNNLICDARILASYNGSEENSVDYSSSRKCTYNFMITQ